MVCGVSRNAWNGSGTGRAGLNVAKVNIDGSRTECGGLVRDAVCGLADACRVVL